MRSLVTCTAHQISYWQNQQEGDGRVMWLLWETEAVHIRFWWGYLRRRDHLEDLGVDGRKI